MVFLLKQQQQQQKHVFDFNYVCMSVPIMRHDIDKKNCSTFLKTKAYSLSTDSKWCTNAIKTLAWHNSETECHLKMKFCTRN